MKVFHKGTLWAATVIAFVSRVVVVVDGTAQFHLSLVGDDTTDYMLDWVTPTTSSSSIVYYGTSSTSLSLKATGKSSGNVVETGNNAVTCWNARLSGLKHGDTVYYSLDQSGSNPTSFSVPSTEMTWAVFGDLGAKTQGMAAGVSFPALSNALLKDKAYHGILNIGDISYELIGKNGADYMQEFEPMTSIVPMHSTIGNHEMQFAVQNALPNYVKRFMGQQNGAGLASGTGSSLFYSFNAGLIHFVFYNTEVYGDEAYMVAQADGTYKPDERARKQAQEDQKNWLEYDLSRVMRENTPYVIVCGHRPPSQIPKSVIDNPNIAFGTQIVPLLDKYGVDLLLSGHEHSYYVVESTKVGSYTLPPFIISGSAGNNEFIRPAASVKMGSFKPKTNINEYGYGYLTATTEKLIWTWGITATDAGKTPSSQNWKQADTIEFKNQKRSNAVPAGKRISTPTSTDGGNTSEVGNDSKPSNSTNSNNNRNNNNSNKGPDVTKSSSASNVIQDATIFNSLIVSTIVLFLSGMA